MANRFYEEIDNFGNVYLKTHGPAIWLTDEPMEGLLWVFYALNAFIQTAKWIGKMEWKLRTRRIQMTQGWVKNSNIIKRHRLAEPHYDMHEFEREYWDFEGYEFVFEGKEIKCVNTDKISFTGVNRITRNLPDCINRGVLSILTPIAYGVE